MKKLISHDKLLEFILAGKAEFTVENEKTGNHRTYYVRKANANNKGVLWFVSLARKQYIGTIIEEVFYPNGMCSKPAKEFGQVFRTIISRRLPEYAKFYHLGKCGRCHRQLTDPESIELGIGPECRKK